MSASGVGVESSILNIEGAKSSGDVNVIVLYSIGAQHDVWCSSVIKWMSARQARGGV